MTHKEVMPKRREKIRKQTFCDTQKNETLSRTKESRQKNYTGKQTAWRSLWLYCCLASRARTWVLRENEREKERLMDQCKYC